MPRKDFMGRLVEITKVNSAEGCFTYHVHEEGRPDFYMRICPEENKVYFYAKNEFSKPDGVVDFNLENNSVIFPGFPSRAPILPALGKAYKAIKANEFPDHLDYCA
jgi:hypothetical protein